MNTQTISTVDCLLVCIEVESNDRLTKKLLIQISHEEDI